MRMTEFTKSNVTRNYSNEIYIITIILCNFCINIILCESQNNKGTTKISYAA